jgi:hypothetical protein
MEITPIWANRCLATRNTLGHRDPVFASTSAFTGVHRGRSSPLGARCRRGRCTWPPAPQEGLGAELGNDPGNCRSTLRVLADPDGRAGPDGPDGAVMALRSTLSHEQDRSGPILTAPRRPLAQLNTTFATSSLKTPAGSLWLGSSAVCGPCCGVLSAVSRPPRKRGPTRLGRIRWTLVDVGVVYG